MAQQLYNRLRRVLCIGGAAPFAQDLLDFISRSDRFSLQTVDNAIGGIALANSMPPFDAILIAASLPDAEGAHVCTKLRECGLNIPIILLAAPCDEREIVRGLDAGASDFIILPIGHAELAARLRAHLRGYETSEEAVLRVGRFQFRPASRVLQSDDTNERVRLTEKEAAVLKFLYAANAPVPRETLLLEVWGYNAKATTHTVETHIYRLRRKIEPIPGAIVLLINEGGGYRLRAEPVKSHTAWQHAAQGLTALEYI